MPLSFGKWRGLSRIAGEDGRFKMLAADQRPPLFKLVDDAKQGASGRDVAAIKRALVAELSPCASAALVDPLHGLPTAAAGLARGCGLIVSLEDHRYQPTCGDGRIARAIRGWSVEKIKRMGGDAVKILVWHHPHAPPHARAAQKEFVRAAGAECRRLDIPLVLETLLYPLGGDAGYAESPQKKPRLVLQSVLDFADPEFGVDVFKLESPLPAASLPAAGRGTAAQRARSWFEELSQAAGRPWVVLSAGVDSQSFANVVRFACEAGAGGYLAGRAIWMEAARAFPDMRALRGRLRAEARPYMESLNKIVDEYAPPLRERPSGATGMGKYPDFGDSSSK